MTSESRLPVPLSLEETAWILRGMIKDPLIAKVSLGQQPTHPLEVRFANLYARLSLYNDALMGKFWSLDEARAAAEVGMFVTREEWRGSFFYQDGESGNFLLADDDPDFSDASLFEPDEVEQEATNYRLWTVKDRRED